MGKLKDELRKKYRTPREALKALGLDEGLLDVQRLAFDGAKQMKPTVIESLAVRFTARAVNPLLAMDKKVEYGPIFKGLTTKNLKTRKPTIMDGLKKALKGNTIAKDASIEHVAEMLDHLEHVAEPKSLDESVSPEQHKAMEAAAHGSSNLGIPKTVGKEFSEADKGKNFDAMIRDWAMSKGMSEDDIEALKKMHEDAMPENALDEKEDGEEAEDHEAEDDAEETEEAEDAEESDGEHAKDAKDTKHGKDSKHAKDRKGAMDSGKKRAITQDELDKALKAQATSLRKNAQEAAEARTFVRSYVGEVSMALDSAEQIHRAAAEAMGIEDAGTVHASALKTLIKTCGRVSSAASEEAGDLAYDGAAAKSFEERFPGAKRIGTA